MKSIASILACVLGLAACAAPGAPSAIWSLQSSATAGAALVRIEAGRETLRIACRRNPADLWVAASTLPGGAGPLELRIGDAAFALAPEADSPDTSASGPLGAAFPAAILARRPIALRRGAHATPPVAPPDTETAAAFAAACRAG